MYSVFTLCERFGKWPAEYDALPDEQKVALLAFHNLRQQEDEEAASQT